MRGLGQWLRESNPQYDTTSATGYLVPKAINTSNLGVLTVSGSGDTTMYHPVTLVYYRAPNYIKIRAFNTNTEITANKPDNYSIWAIIIGMAV